MRRIALPAIAASLLLGAGAVQAQNPTVVQMRLSEGVPPPPALAFRLYKVQMIRLREEALAQQARDGGTLSPEHDADIQRQIDRITQLYHRRLQGLDA